MLVRRRIHVCQWVSAATKRGGPTGRQSLNKIRIGLVSTAVFGVLTLVFLTAATTAGRDRLSDDRERIEARYVYGQSRAAFVQAMADKAVPSDFVRDIENTSQQLASMAKVGNASDLDNALKTNAKLLPFAQGSTDGSDVVEALRAFSAQTSGIRPMSGPLFIIAYFAMFGCLAAIVATFAIWRRATRRRLSTGMIVGALLVAIVALALAADGSRLSRDLANANDTLAGLMDVRQDLTLLEDASLSGTCAVVAQRIALPSSMVGTKASLTTIDAEGKARMNAVAASNCATPDVSAAGATLLARTLALHDRAVVDLGEAKNVLSTDLTFGFLTVLAGVAIAVADMRSKRVDF
jgi:hypothetical protein